MWRQSYWIPIAAIFVWPFVIWIAQRFQQTKIQAQRDVQLALLAKFSSGEELSRFLATDEGGRLMDHLASPARMTHASMPPVCSSAVRSWRCWRSASRFWR